LRVPFATVVVATYDAVAGTLTYASAGHPHPILLGLGAHPPVLAFGSPPIGMGGPTGRRQTTVSLPAPSVACLYTDGLTEARVNGELLGEERLAQLLSGLGPAATATELLERVAEEADELSDDMAACVFRPGENGALAGEWTEELEADVLELMGPHLERFLAACGLPTEAISAACSSVTAAADEAGTALIRVHRRAGELTWEVTHAGAEAAGSALMPVR